MDQADACIGYSHDLLAGKLANHARFIRVAMYGYRFSYHPQRLYNSQLHQIASVQNQVDRVQALNEL